MSEVDLAVAHAFELFQRHVELYRQEILVSPLEWRTRCSDLHSELQWLLFCQAHPLAPPPRKPKPDIPPPPPLRR